MNHDQGPVMQDGFQISEGDFASDWSDFQTAPNQVIPQPVVDAKPSQEKQHTGLSDFFSSDDFWNMDSSPVVGADPVKCPEVPKPELEAELEPELESPSAQETTLDAIGFPDSSPPKGDPISLLSSQKLNELINDSEWGDNSQEQMKDKPIELDIVSEDFFGSSFSETRPSLPETKSIVEKKITSTPVKSQMIGSSISWSQSPDWHKTETIFSKQSGLVQDNLPRDPCGVKRRFESPVKAPKAPKSSNVATPAKHNDIKLPIVPEVIHEKVVKSESTTKSKSRSPSIVLGKGTTPKNIHQSKLTSFISPVVRKAHASTLAMDMHNISKMTKNPGVIAPIFLTEEQRRILSMVVDEQRNIFFTGAAGTGKSVLLRRIISELRHKYRKKGNQPVAVTASTGLAACNIGGMTLHSFGGIGLGAEPVSRLVDKIRKNKKANRRWKDTKVLIIDEISMIDGGLFDKLEEISRIINKNDQPFGGIQLVITGDFFQLPPVFKPSNVPSAFGAPGGGLQIKNSFMDEPQTEGKFSFEAESWKSVVTTTVELKQVFRQKDDRFSSMLNSIRAGNVTNEIEKAFQKLSRIPHVPGDIMPTELYPLRRDVDNANRRKMSQLSGTAVKFEAQDVYMSDIAQEQGKLELLMCPKELVVKRGAQVMLIKNLDDTLVNGSLGKVIGFMSESSFMLFKELPEAQAERVIKGEISAEDAVEEFLHEDSRPKKKLESEKEYKFDDIEYEALMELEDSRLSENPTDNGLGDVETKEVEIEHGSTIHVELSDDNDDAFGIKDVPKEVVENDPYGVNWERKRALIKLMNKNCNTLGQKWPYIRFLLQDGTTRDILVQPETWTLEDPEGRTEASRSQVPLILAWALSIHKSQGQTLEWVKVDLSRVFEAGQAYVALSRAVRMEGLQVMGFTRHKIRVHPKVIEFYAGLVSALDVKKEEQQQKAKALEGKEGGEYYNEDGDDEDYEEEYEEDAPRIKRKTRSSRRLKFAG